MNPLATFWTALNLGISLFVFLQHTQIVGGTVTRLEALFTFVGCRIKYGQAGLGTKGKDIFVVLRVEVTDLVTQSDIRFFGRCNIGQITKAGDSRGQDGYNGEQGR